MGKKQQTQLQQEAMLQQKALPEQKESCSKERSRVRRILAWAGIVLLLVLYVVTFVAAMFSSPASNGLFLASLTLTFVIPAAIYVYQWIRRVIKKE